MFKGALIILMIEAMPIIGTFRLWHVTKTWFNGTLRIKNVTGLELLAILGYLLLLSSLIVLWGIVIVTFFFMKSGGASGIPLAFGGVAFPIAWGVSELLIAAGFESTPAKS